MKSKELGLCIESLPEKEKENFETIKKIVRNHWSLSNESLKRFENELDNPFYDEVYAKILKENNSKDRRIRYKIPDEKCKIFDKGWKTFIERFSRFVEYYDVSYSDFKANKVLVNKNLIKLRKLLIKYYTEIDKYAGTRVAGMNNSCLFGDEKDKEKGEEQIKNFGNTIDRILEDIGAKALPKNGSLELVISFNFADWFLASSGEDWGSCLNVNSDYSYAYWSGLPGLITDKNRAMVYVTSGKKKEVYGVKTDSFITRSWIVLSEKDIFGLVNWYPSKFISEKFINEITGLNFSEKAMYDREFKSKYSIKNDLLYFNNKKSVFIYQDNIVFSEDGYFYGDNSSGFYYFIEGSNTLFDDSEIFSYEEGLEDLIEYNNSLEKYYTENDVVYCEICGEALPSDDAYYFEGQCYCEHCYNENITTCSKCGTEIWIDDATEAEGDFYCESCYDDLFYNCENCGEPVRITESYSNTEDSHYCSLECAINDDNGVCSECGEIAPVDEMIIYEDKYYCSNKCAEKNDIYVCETCEEAHKKEDIEILYNGEIICKNCLQKEIDKKQIFFEFEKIA